MKPNIVVDGKPPCYNTASRRLSRIVFHWQADEFSHRVA